ncbi:exodeoxyribonuclease VII large subunit [Candidatus Saccharibacteria bacterium]|nr:exodeoxyribonuclease VII large subunit [Candidatus Saccharibacteria bacterium]
MDNQVLSVTELREYISQTLSYAYPLVTVEGEVSNYKVNQGKWVFFDLKDKDTTLGCFMTIYQVKTVITDGMLVRVAVTPNITKWGKFSLTVKALELAGAGEVKQAFDQLKARFEAEGIFASERKRLLPTYPISIGLITSKEAAAYQDFLVIAQDRWPLAQIEHIHVHVQGMQAPNEIVSAIRWFNTFRPELEALVIIRGGGSPEDLQAFNHEDVVRAVYASHIPTIVGIGHEDDISLAELASDVRAATPTDAARRLLPDKTEVLRLLQATQSRHVRALEQRLERVRTLSQHLRSLLIRADRQAKDRVGQYQDRLIAALQRHMLGWKYQLGLAKRTLAGADPARVLARGYAIARQDGQLLRDPALVQPQKPILVQLHKGTIEVKIRSHHDENN